MRLTFLGLTDYVADLAYLAEKYGITPDLPPHQPLSPEIEPDGTRRFDLGGSLPHGSALSTAVIHVAERWLPHTDGYERSSYRYELLDHERGFRRAFHWHDAAHFERIYGVVVHEHCEVPIGTSPCPHLFGPPIKDGYRGLELLVAAWVAEPPDCTALPCLEPI